MLFCAGEGAGELVSALSVPAAQSPSQSQCHLHMYIYTCRLMRRRIKVANPRIFLIYAAYMNICEEVVDEYHYTFAAPDTADQWQGF